jgi:4-amino-4-deoxy-L-arabinose transferase-like glycosyltransferase
VIELTIPNLASLRTEVLERVRPARLDWALAGALFALALVARVYDLVDVPPGLHGDEGWTGLRARDILDGTKIGAFDATHGLGQPAGMEYLTAVFTAIFGSSVLTLRLPMALLGAATVPMLYALLRLTAGRTAAVMGALLLAVLAWHIHFSRIALPPVSWPFFAVLTCLLFVLAMRSKQWWLFALTGLSLGLGVYTYSSYGVFVVAFAVFVVYWLLTQEREVNRRLLADVGLIFVVALLAAIPMLHYISEHQEQYFSYPREISVFNSEAYEAADGVLGRADVVADAGREYVRRVVFDADPDFSDGSNSGPMIDAPFAALVGLGILYALWQWRKPAGVLGLLMVLLLPWAGILSTGGGIIRRTIGVTPYLALLAGLPLAALIERTEHAGQAVRRGAYLVVGGLVIAIAVLDLQAYFGDFPDTDAGRYVFVPELVAASHYMDDLPDGTFVLFYSGRWSLNYETRRYLAPDIQGQDRSKEFGRFSLEADRSRNVAFVFMDPYRNNLEEVERFYPGGTSVEGTTGEGVPAFSAYYVPALGPGEEPPVPPPTPLPSPTEEILPGGEERDAVRAADMARIEEALAEYRREHGEYPDNGGGIQTLCAFKDSDVGCDLDEFLDPLPEDPLGEETNNGYFYSSDGSFYTIFARRESEALPACAEHPQHLQHLSSLLCVHGP